MTLLFDQNISFRIIKIVQDIFPGSLSVKELNLENQHDIQIWNYAKSKNLTIVTFDSDFIDLSNLKGSPPKIIWLRLGNTATKNISDRLRDESKNIIDFIDNSDNAILEIS